MTSDPVKEYQTDHDLLVRLDERYGAMHQDIKEMKTGTATRLDNLESDHVSRDEYNALNADVLNLKMWKSYLIGAWAVTSFILTVVLVPLAFAYFGR